MTEQPVATWPSTLMHHDRALGATWPSSLMHHGRALGATWCNMFGILSVILNYWKEVPCKLVLLILTSLDESLSLGLIASGHAYTDINIWERGIPKLTSNSSQRGEKRLLPSRETTHKAGLEHFKLRMNYHTNVLGLSRTNTTPSTPLHVAQDYTSRRQHYTMPTPALCYTIRKNLNKF